MRTSQACVALPRRVVTMSGVAYSSTPAQTLLPAVIQCTAQFVRAVRNEILGQMALSRIHAVGNAARTPAENDGAQEKAPDPHRRGVTFW